MSGKLGKRMSGKYPITRETCPVCEELSDELGTPIVEKKFSSRVLKPRNSPVHNWYTFVHSYSPKFVEYEIGKKGISSDEKVLDPFVGAGTTLVSCKLNGIDSLGVDVIDFLVFASKVKTDWNVDRNNLENKAKKVAKKVLEKKFRNELKLERPKLMKDPYICDDPLAQLQSLKKEISRINDKKIQNLFKLVLSSLVVPSSNVRFGPNFGLIKPRENVDVVGMFKKKVNRILKDLKEVQPLRDNAKVEVKRGDTRQIGSILNQKFDHVITSPPYPQDHDYSRQTRLELILLDYVKDMKDLRKLKKRMVRASTRGIYKEDNDYQYVQKFKEISSLVSRIKNRVEETGGTSGFEKLYHRLVGEYFGGMYRCLKEIYEILNSDGTCSFLVGDSHAFKMTHIQTAELLGKVSLDIGFKEYETKYWQYSARLSGSGIYP